MEDNRDLSGHQRSTIVVAASNSKKPDTADFRGDGTANQVEINAALNSLPDNTTRSQERLETKYGRKEWFKELSHYLTDRYQLIEGKMEETRWFVELHEDNKEVFSYEFANILRSAGSAFGSVMDRLVRATTTKPKKQYDFGDYRTLLIRDVSNIHLRTVAVSALFPKVLVPFSALKDKDNGKPKWWNAYNNLKHSETTEYKDGNLANALVSLAALSIIGSEMGCFVRTRLFVNIGIVCQPKDIAVQRDRILFDMNQTKEKI